MSDPAEDQKPPLFGSWKGWYWLVWLFMVAQVIVYLLITRSFE